MGWFYGVIHGTVHTLSWLIAMNRVKFGNLFLTRNLENEPLIRLFPNSGVQFELQNIEKQGECQVGDVIGHGNIKVGDVKITSGVKDGRKFVRFDFLNMNHAFEREFGDDSQIIAMVAGSPEILDCEEPHCIDVWEKRA